MKYLVFGWSHEAKKNRGPADELLGTVDGPLEEFEQPQDKKWYLEYRDEDVTLASHLMFGKKFPMTVVYSHGWLDGPSRVTAYYEVPGT